MNVQDENVREAIIGTVLAGVSATLFMLFVELNIRYMPIVVSGVCSGVLVFAWRRSRLIEIANSDKYIDERYASELICDGYVACVILLHLIVLAGFYAEDYRTVYILGLVVIGIAAFGWLTNIRTKNGWFADNQFEALELVNFIIDKSHSGGVPPGSRVHRPTFLATESEESVGQTAGSRR